MFNRNSFFSSIASYLSKSEQDEFFDYEEEEVVPFLDEVVIEPIIQSVNQQLEQKPLLFLTDEVEACIQILEQAAKKVVVDKRKIDDVHYYYRRIYILQLALSVGVSGASFIPFILNRFNAASLLEGIKDKMSDLNIKLNEAKQNLVSDFNENCGGSNKLDEASFNICGVLRKRSCYQDLWWERGQGESRWDSYAAGCVNVEGGSFSASSRVIPECGRLGGRAGGSWVSELPDFNGIDFCQFSNKLEKNECKYLSKEICASDSDLKVYMKESEVESFHSLINKNLDAQYRLSALEFQQNQLDKAYYETSHIFVPHIIIGAGITFAAMGYLAFLIVKMKRAYAEYKEELARADDFYRCVDDPKIANRIINLTSRLGISLKDAKVSTLIKYLREDLDDIQARRRVRLAFVSGFQKGVEPLQGGGAWRDVYKEVLRHADLAPDQQAPRPKPSMD